MAELSNEKKKKSVDRQWFLVTATFLPMDQLGLMICIGKKLSVTKALVIVYAILTWYIYIFNIHNTVYCIYN